MAAKKGRTRSKIDADGLTAKQAQFVKEYLIDLNATQAAIRAGYSKKTARQIGEENLTKPDIAAAVKKAVESRANRTEITADRVLKELGRLAFFDMRKLYADDGTLKPPREWDDDTAAALAGLDVVETQNAEVDGEGNITYTPQFVKKAKVWDKGGALTLAMKHLGMLTEKVELSGKVTGNIQYVAEMPPRRG